MDTLHEIQTQTHAQYKDFLEKNKTNKVFGLDSFNYQTRLFDLEMKHVKEHYAFVNNRIYCDYYKLYGMVKTFYKENFKLEPKKRNYMPYKDLEPFKPFEFLDSMNLNQDILDMIQKSFEIIRKKEQEVSTGSHTLQRLNIENYIFNHRYNNDSLKTKVELYEKYLHSYHIYHMSFITNLLAKVSMLFQQNTQPLSINPIEPTANQILSSEVPMVSQVPVGLTDASNVSVPVAVVPVAVVPVAEPLSVPVEVPKEETKEEPVEETKESEEPVKEPVEPKEVEEPKEEPSEEKEEPKESEEPKEEPKEIVPDVEETKEEVIEDVVVSAVEEPTTVSVEVQAVPPEVHEKTKKKSKKSKK
jgi:hypothetical protein